MPRLIPLAACMTPPTPAKPHSSLAALPAPPLASGLRGDLRPPPERPRTPSGAAGGGAAQKERKKRTAWKLRKRRGGPSAELSDTRRRGSSHARRSTPRGEEAVSGRRSVAARNAAKATGASTRGAGVRPRSLAGATNTRGAMGGKFRRRKPSTPKPIEAGCAGLRPEGVYAYATGRMDAHAARAAQGARLRRNLPCADRQGQSRRSGRKKDYYTSRNRSQPMFIALRFAFELKKS